MEINELKNFISSKNINRDSQLDEFDYVYLTSDKSIWDKILLLDDYDFIEVLIKTARVINNKCLFNSIYDINSSFDDDCDKICFLAGMIMYESNDDDDLNIYASNKIKSVIMKNKNKKRTNK